MFSADGLLTVRKSRGQFVSATIAPPSRIRVMRIRSRCPARESGRAPATRSPGASVNQEEGAEDEYGEFPPHEEVLHCCRDGSSAACRHCHESTARSARRAFPITEDAAVLARIADLLLDNRLESTRTDGTRVPIVPKQRRASAGDIRQVT
jgi:hypothetical protein